METAEQATASLHKNVNPQLKKMGHENVNIIPATEEGIPLTEELKQLGADVGNYTEATIQDAVGGVTTHSRFTKSRNPLQILKEKIGLRFSKKYPPVQTQEQPGGKIIQFPNKQPLEKAA